MYQQQGYNKVMLGVAFENSLDETRNNRYPAQKLRSKKTGKLYGYALRHAFMSNSTSIENAYSNNSLYAANKDKTGEYQLGEHGRYYIFISQR
jgi:hypothetical protein